MPSRSCTRSGVTARINSSSRSASHTNTGTSAPARATARRTTGSSPASHSPTTRSPAPAGPKRATCGQSRARPDRHDGGLERLQVTALCAGERLDRDLVADALDEDHGGRLAESRQRLSGRLGRRGRPTHIPVRHPLDAPGTPTACSHHEHRMPAAGPNTMRLWPPTRRRSPSSRPARRPGRTSRPWLARRGAGTRCASVSASSSAFGTGRRRPPTSGPRCCVSRSTAATRSRMPPPGCWRTSAVSRPAGAASNRAPALPLIPEQRTWCKRRGQDPTDDRVWVVACFVTRTPFRYAGVSRTLAAEAVEFARGRGAGAVEGYAMITQPGVEITWGELHVGSRSIFADAGMSQVAAPTKRRVVMRIDFCGEPSGCARRNLGPVVPTERSGRVVIPRIRERRHPDRGHVFRARTCVPVGGGHDPLGQPRARTSRPNDPAGPARPRPNTGITVRVKIDTGQIARPRKRQCQRRYKRGGASPSSYVAPGPVDDPPSACNR